MNQEQCDLMLSVCAPDIPIMIFLNFDLFSENLSVESGLEIANGTDVIGYLSADIGVIFSFLGPDICEYLPALHALTGLDVTQRLIFLMLESRRYLFELFFILT